MTFDQQLQLLNKKKEKLHSQVEVISYAIGDINKQITDLFGKQYLGRQVKFHNNESAYFHDNTWKISIPEDIPFKVIEIILNEQGVNFLLQNDSIGLILIKFNNLKNIEMS